MGQCPLLDECHFFNNILKNTPAAVEMMKTIYCLDDYKPCARYMVAEALGREAVPEDMFPIQKERAEKIITADK